MSKSSASITDVANYLKQGRGESLETAERQALIELTTELDGHLSLTEKAFNLIGAVVSILPEVLAKDLSQSRKVAAALLIRLSNDLRSAALIASRGYALQAATLVGSMYETAYTIAAIGSDNGLAEEWINHDDPTRTFKQVRDLTRQGLAKLGVPDVDAQVATEYRVYRQLCLAKHVNPLLQIQHGHRIDGHNVVAMNGPDFSEPAVRVAWFALEHAAGLAFIALASFISNHIPREKMADLMKETEAVGAGRKALEASAKARWGTEDPFPGKW
jgi:hypothetical protein